MTITNQTTGTDDALFDPQKLFDSPTAAVQYCSKQSSPRDALLAVVRANIDYGEYGFASEVVRDAEDVI